MRKPSRILPEALVAFVLVINSSLRLLAQATPANVTNISLGLAYGASVAGHYVYVATSGGLRIFDISNPANPVDVGYSDSDGPALAVAVSGQYRYASHLAGVTILDGANPAIPVAVGIAHSPLYGFGDFYAQAHRLEVSGNHAYLATDNGLSVYALGVSAPPPLAITNASANILLLYWPTPTSAFAVQQNPDLNPAHWTTLTNTSMVVGSQNQITVPKPPGTMFYRLVSQ